MMAEQGTRARGAWLLAVVATLGGLMLWDGVPLGATAAGCLFVVELWLCWTHRSDLTALRPYEPLSRGWPPRRRP